MSNIIADISVTHLGLGLGYRATLHGHGGAATMGYGDTEDAARDDLTKNVAWNVQHHGRGVI